MLKCLVLIPALPSGTNGVADFAMQLVQGLNEEVSFRVEAISQPLGRRVWDLLSSFSWIHLHYVGYGYARRGVAMELLQALRRWKDVGDRCLMVTFHELFASNHRPWQSSFYLQGWQRLVFRGIRQLADVAVVSNHAHAHYFPDPVRVLPVFSNVPPPRKPTPFSHREDALVIWGNHRARMQAYALLQRELPHFSDQWNIRKIWDIGPGGRGTLRLPIPIYQQEYLPLPHLSRLLDRSKVGLMAFHAPCMLAKSGVFAAFASHGLAVLAGAASEASLADGLSPGTHYLGAGNTKDSNPRTLAGRLLEWYKGHSLEVHIGTIYRPAFQGHAPHLGQ